MDIRTLASRTLGGVIGVIILLLVPGHIVIAATTREEQ